MRVLVMGEQSQVVVEQFILMGHDAMSCDYQPGEKGLPHYRGNVLDILYDGWDLLIGHPPCTFMANVQAIHYNEIKWPEKTRMRKIKRDEAIEFFRLLQNAPIESIGLENPLPQRYVTDRIGKYDQIIQPWMFGDPFSKKTCLWLKNLPKLEATNIVGKGEFNKGKDGRTNAKWYHDLPPKDRAKIRSRTFIGIAKAMASQWGNINEYKKAI